MPLTSHTLSATEIVAGYHQRTKHHFQRYAAGPDGLDWNTQPNPFRHFEGAPQIRLALQADSLTTPFAALYNGENIAPHPLNINSISALLELSFAISAWKAYGGDRWALRCNPSSGNLHPTETYIIIPELSGASLAAGVYHYGSREHLLEQRTKNTDFKWENGFFIGLSSITWRESWKYGERAFRYCQHDIGHAIAAVAYAAATLGWQMRVCWEWGDADVAALLGLARTADFEEVEQEIPEILLWVETYPDAIMPSIETLLSALQSASWMGKANSLTDLPHQIWNIIEVVAQAAKKPRSAAVGWQAHVNAPLVPTACNTAAATLIRQRRSAQHFDNKTPLSAADFYRLLDCTLPRADNFLWEGFAQTARVHLLLFVHRVVDVPAGLYFLVRNPNHFNDLKAKMRQQFAWVKPDNCPEHIPLYCLIRANTQRAAMNVSCHQQIAGESAFSLGMIAQFEQSIVEGAWQYRRLFWETGYIGQVLYLEAEAAGVRGTGIGCFFDDACHEIGGFTDGEYQSLYHFTVGTALEDKRLMTLPPYS